MYSDSTNQIVTMFICQHCTRLLSLRAPHRQPRKLHFAPSCARFQTAKWKSWATPRLLCSASHNGVEREAGNPLFSTNQYVKEPIFKDHDIIFRPTQADVQEASELFENGRKHKVTFMKGAYHPEQAPDYILPEIAMLGRSNVGKSSLIKALFHNVPDLTVRTSRTPGHTKLLLFYRAGKSFSLVDLPGYGVRQPENFAVTAESFLRTRKNLQMAFLLVDILEVFRTEDFTAIRMLEDFSRPYSVVITKSDKASPRRLVTSLLAIREVIQEQTATCLPQPFLVSATKMQGIAFLRCFIAHITRNVKAR